MNKEEYVKALKSPKWKAKRKKIKKRDDYKCTKCGCKKGLHVHHTYYLEGKMPWEVPDDCLITLCSVCHEKEHEGKDIKSFIRKSPPNTQNKEPKKLKPLVVKPKLKKLRFYRFIALKSKTFKKVYDKSTDMRDIRVIAKSVSGEMKGFDCKFLAEQWLGQKKRKCL